MSDTGKTAAQAFDLEELLERTDNDPELIGELIDQFFQNEPDLIQGTRRAVDGNNGEGLMHAAHKLKGALLTLSAHPAARAAFALEEIGRTKEMARGAEHLKTLLDELLRLRGELTDYRASI